MNDKPTTRDELLAMFMRLQMGALKISNLSLHFYPPSGEIQTLGLAAHYIQRYIQALLKLNGLEQSTKLDNIVPMSFLAAMIRSDELAPLRLYSEERTRATAEFMAKHGEDE